MTSVKRFIERKLKLKVNETKSQVAKTDQTNFLGFTFKGTKIRWSDKAFCEFKRRVKKLTGRSWFVTMEYRLSKLALYLRGWMHYFGISQYYRPLPEMDHWLRRRVRMCYWFNDPRLIARTWICLLLAYPRRIRQYSYSYALPTKQTVALCTYQNTQSPQARHSSMCSHPNEPFS